MCQDGTMDATVYNVSDGIQYEYRQYTMGIQGIIDTIMIIIAIGIKSHYCHITTHRNQYQESLLSHYNSPLWLGPSTFFLFGYLQVLVTELQLLPPGLGMIVKGDYLGN